MTTPDEYDELAAQAIMDLLAREYAVVWLEVEAKLAELPNFQYSIPLPKGINPHHLSAGRQLLQARGLIQQSSARSRGGASVPYLEPTDRRGRARAIDTAAARKRLLTARFYGWGIARNKRPNLLGTAGERVVHASLLEASPTAGYKLLSNTPATCAMSWANQCPWDRWTAAHTC